MSKEPVHRTWYKVALATPGATQSRIVAASGEHMGQAIAHARDHVKGSWPVAVDNASGKDIPLGESVGKEHAIDLGEEQGLPAFRWPTGVLPALPGAASYAKARAGWMVHTDPKLLVIEAQVEDENVTDLFMGLIERLPAGDNLEIRLMDHFDDAGTTDVWLTGRVDAKKIIRFLDDHDVELIGNGHLELAVYVRKHKATLKLSEHKTVLWVAQDRALETEVKTWLRDLNVPQVESLVGVRDGQHFHYRPAKSRDRKKLEAELYKQRMRKVDSVKR